MQHDVEMLDFRRAHAQPVVSINLEESPMRYQRVLYLVWLTLPGLASAQSGINPGALGARDPGRILERMERRAATHDRVARSATAAAAPNYVLSLSPSYVTSDGLKVYGVSTAITNAQQANPPIPFKFSLSDKSLDVAGDTHNRVQADLELDSPVGLLPLDANSSALVTGEYQHTAGLSNSQEVTAELDHAFAFTSTVISVSAIEYYDRSVPNGAQSVDGFTTGLAGALSYTVTPRYKLGLGGEYDINSTYNGEATYNGQASISAQTLTLRPSVFVGWARHDVVVVGATIRWP